MIVLHLSSVSWKAIAGPNFSVPQLVAAQNLIEGVRAGLVNTQLRSGVQPDDLGFPVFDHRRLFRPARGLALPAPFDRPDICVFHSSYIPIHALLAAKLRRAGIPYVLCPRGGACRFAQTVKPLKKRIGNLLFFRGFVDGTAAIHCLSDGEALASTQWNRHIFVAGNGVHLPEHPLVATPGSAPTRRLLFLGRLDIRIKGLDLLTDACASIRSELLESGAVVDLFGPYWRRDKRPLTRMIERKGLRDVVLVHQTVRGRAKALVLAEHDAFLQTSRTEAHSMAALEALGAGLPCLLTRSGHMADEVAAAGAGWALEANAEDIARGIREVVRCPAIDLQRAGTNARKLAADQFSWQRNAALTIEAYRQLIQPPALRRTA